jgi:hypothetical protein
MNCARPGEPSRGTPRCIPPTIKGGAIAPNATATANTVKLCSLVRSPIDYLLRRARER